MWSIILMGQSAIEKDKESLIQFRNSVLTAVGLIASIIIGLYTVLLNKKIPIIQLTVTDVTLSYILIIDLAIGAVSYFAINLIIFGRTRAMYGMSLALFNQLKMFGFLKNHALSLSFEIEKQDIDYIVRLEMYMTILVAFPYHILNAYINMSKSILLRSNRTQAEQTITALRQQMGLGTVLLRENKSELIKDNNLIVLDRQVTAAGQLDPILSERDEAPKKRKGSKQRRVK